MSKKYTKAMANRELARAKAKALDDEIRKVQGQVDTATTPQARFKLTEKLVNLKSQRAAIRLRKRSQK